MTTARPFEATPPPDPTPTPAQVQKDLQRLIALTPPIDPETGQRFYAGRGAAQYREFLQGILDRYGSFELFQEAAGLPSPASAPEPTKPPQRPTPPNLMAASPGVPSLMQFAQSLMASGPPPTAAGNAGPSAPMQRRGAETIT